MKTDSFHYIARGIIRDGEHLLLCKQKDGDYTFLLGGHIEFGEAAEIALVRELKEEIDADVIVNNFRGAIENMWDSQCEISLVFDVEHTLSNDITPLPASENEEHLEFVWAKTNELTQHNLLPTPLIKLLQDDDTTPFWASTIMQ